MKMEQEVIRQREAAKLCQMEGGNPNAKVISSDKDPEVKIISSDGDLGVKVVSPAAFPSPESVPPDGSATKPHFSELI